MKSLLLLCLSMLAVHAHAGPAEDAIKLALNPLLPGMPIEKVTHAPALGLYEVVTPSAIFYTDSKGSFLIANATVIDSVSKRNLTQERMEALGAFEFSSLPLDDAIANVQGDGSRKLVTFEDPACGYCRKLMQEIAKLDNVTVYTFLVPMLSPESGEQAKAIWCAPDRGAAWRDYMLGKAALPAKRDCANPLARNSALQHKLRVLGTPNLMFASNTRANGFIPAAQIEARLALPAARQRP